MRPRPTKKVVAACTFTISGPDPRCRATPLLIHAIRAIERTHRIARRHRILQKHTHLHGVGEPIGCGATEAMETKDHAHRVGREIIDQLHRVRVADRNVLKAINQQVAAKGDHPATAQPVLLSISKAAMESPSFLGSAAFQNTTSVLARAAVLGKTDEGRGMQTSVMTGKLIPAGTGFKQ